MAPHRVPLQGKDHDPREVAATLNVRAVPAAWCSAVDLNVQAEPWMGKTAPSWGEQYSQQVCDIQTVQEIASSISVP
jgi:hypothetical protein